MAYVTFYGCGGAYLLHAGDGRTILFQRDYDYPGLASNLGWSPLNVSCGDCPHHATDGTVDCPDCGTKAIAFIESAVEWLDAHEGVDFKDPGYFAEED